MKNNKKNEIQHSNYTHISPSALTNFLIMAEIELCTCDVRSSSPTSQMELG